MIKESGYGSAPGKVIISGEHSVVYKYPALATALDLRCNVIARNSTSGLAIIAEDLEMQFNYSIEDLHKLNNGTVIHNKIDGIARIVIAMLDEVSLELRIKSQIPISAGLGSSAAVAVATVAAIADLKEISLTREKISEYAFISEKIIHGKPSGIDNSIATHGGLLVFQDGKIELKELKHQIPLVIINSKVPRDTKKLVGGVSKLRDKIPVLNSILASMGELTNEVISAVDNGNINMLEDLFRINQGLLDSIGVGHPVISQIIQKLNKLGISGAKLTGAGGGGCLIAILSDITQKDMIIRELGSMDLDIFFTNASKTGVMLGESKL